MRVTAEVVELDDKLVHVRVYTETESQKQILIGKGGTMVREIGRKARPGIEQLIGHQIHLQLQVKASPKWRRNQTMLERLGLSSDGVIRRRGRESTRSTSGPWRSSHQTNAVTAGATRSSRFPGLMRGVCPAQRCANASLVPAHPPRATGGCPRVPCPGLSPGHGRPGRACVAASGGCRLRTGMTWSGTAGPRARWTRAGSGSATRQAERRRRQPRPRRSGQAADAAALARRVRGAVLRARGLGARVAGRAGARGARRATASSTARTSTSTPSSPARKGSSTSSSGRGIATEIGWLPRSRAIRIGWPWVEGRDDDPWDTEAEAAPLEHGEPSPRPDNIVNVDEVELEDNGTMTTAPLATRERSVQAGLHWEQVAPGKRGSVPHCHSEEEEVFVILDGEGTLELWPSPLREARGARREDVPIRAGPRDRASARARGIAHSFLAGATGLTMLIYGTRRPDDMAWYPRSQKISWRGLGVIGRIEALDYDDGEPDE